jgi:hypothetical protein
LSDAVFCRGRFHQQGRKSKSIGGVEMRNCLLVVILFSPSVSVAADEMVDADLLVVGGTESGCAAAVQAARMGVKRIVFVNDIEWLGGQFSAESLGAIDENRAHDYDGKVPIPRSGLFREVIDAIEFRNAQLYGGVQRPGNTRVITTVRPIVAEQVFRDLLKPHEATGRIKRYSNFRVHAVKISDRRVTSVVFKSTDQAQTTLTVNAQLTIDASDWGDIIKASGAAYDFGIDSRDEFQEPTAPTSNEPTTDLNPITYCMIVVEQPAESLLPKPLGYDAGNFQGTWGWIEEDFAYTTRRLVDGHGFQQIKHPDVLLINNPNIDYPIDQYSAAVAQALETTQPGASRKNIVQMTPQQRQIVFDDAKNRSLQYLFYLQSKFPKFRRMALSEEFGTPDRLPPKPYIRESLRLVAKHVLKEQEVLGFGGRSNYATAMFPDAVFSWQFELDFHPTAKKWMSDKGNAGPWEAVFRGQRKFGNGGTGRAVFPLRSFVPKQIAGLLGAQKNLGYTSIVSSSCRLHDQSTIAGQACGAVAAVSLKRSIEPAEMWLDSRAMADVWNGLLATQHGTPVAIWPFADVDPYDKGFVAIQQLALRRLFPLQAGDTEFKPDDKPAPDWKQAVSLQLSQRGYETALSIFDGKTTRRACAIVLWDHVQKQPIPRHKRHSPDDADGDEIPDSRDPLPFTAGIVSWKLPPGDDGLPAAKFPFPDQIEAFNFTTANAPHAAGFKHDFGGRYTDTAGYGWLQDLTQNTRLRRLDAETIRDGFVFTRKQDTWERRLPNGRYHVTVCVGDSGHDQSGQNASIEGQSLGENIDTQRGAFAELSADVEVKDGRLTVTIGKPDGGSNTTLNWLLINRKHETPAQK